MLRDPAFPETFESAAILDEVRGDLGLLLWQTSRDVLLWGATAPEQRDGLFAAGSEVEQDRLLDSMADDWLYDAVHELIACLRNAGDDEGRRVVECCEEVARWAANSGLEQTAIAFAQAAATVIPTDPALYVGAGRLLARSQRRTAAETWFRRGVALARRAGDWGSYAGAWLELGWLHAARGERQSAGRAFKRVVRVSRRAKGLRLVRARAYYGMMRVLAVAGDYADAKQHGAKSLRWFGDHREHTAVTHELAALMMEQDPVANACECSERLRAVLPLRRSGVDRIATLTLLVRAAGYAGEATILADAWFDAVRAIERLDTSADRVRRLLDLARAGRDTPGMDATRVAEVALLAFDGAVRVDDKQLEQEADALRLELLRA